MSGWMDWLAGWLTEWGLRDCSQAHWCAVLPTVSHPRVCPPAPCPAAAGFKGGVNNWAPMWDAAVAASGGLPNFARLLAAGGVFYHLYNQVSGGGRGGGREVGGKGRLGVPFMVCRGVKGRRGALLHTASRAAEAMCLWPAAAVLPATHAPLPCFFHPLPLQASYMVLDQGISPVTFSGGCRR